MQKDRGIPSVWAVVRTKPHLIFIVLVVIIGIIILIQVEFTEISSLTASVGVRLDVRPKSGRLILNAESYVTEETPPAKKYTLPDVHIEDPKFGHTGDVDWIKAPVPLELNAKIAERSVAIGVGVTSRGVRGLTGYTIGSHFPLMRSFLPSFCKTASDGYSYHFYVAHDHNDGFFTNEIHHKAFVDGFYSVVEKLCDGKYNVTLHMVKCSHSGKPGWAQNDALIEAYLDNHAYYFRINDDSVVQTPDWTLAFVDALEAYSPTNVGVVGPNHRGGNEAILTYDFTHHNHITIFGFHYPHEFTDWFADDWVTRVYQPGRSSKIDHVHLVHTMDTGTRYDPEAGRAELVQGRLEKDRQVLQRYLKAVEDTSHPQPSKSRIIAMSLYGKNTQYTWGAIRNAQLVRVYFPEWTLRVYVEKYDPDTLFKNPRVPERILNKIKTLGGEVQEVDTNEVRVAPMMWRFLVADDMTVEHFIVRDADSRLSDRDAAVVREWMNSGKAFHCIRDHPSHSGFAVSGGMWGGKPKDLKEILGQSFETLMKGYNSEYLQDMNFLAEKIWPRVQNHAFCHDSVSCTKWPSSHPFPVERAGEEHIGQVFDQFGAGRTGDILILRGSPAVPECTKADPTNNLLNMMAASRAKAPPLRLRNITTSVVFWSMDTRIGPIRDVKFLLEPAGVKFIDKSLSGNCNRTKTCAVNLKVINAGNVLSGSVELKKQFFDAYKGDNEMKQVTHFICMFPVATCEMYKIFRKGIVVIITSRYEYGRLTPEYWDTLNKNLKSIASDSRSLVATNNKYDQKYFKYYTGVDIPILPSICGYVDVSYTPIKSEYLLTPVAVSQFQDEFFSNFEMARQNLAAPVSLVFQSKELPTYKYTDLAMYMGIVYIPQDVSEVTFCEMYRMALPMFVPTVDLLATWQQEWGIMPKLTLNDLRRSLKVTKTLAGVQSWGSPNQLQNKGVLKDWLKLADIYQRPHVAQFESIDHLVELLRDTDLRTASKRMKAYNKELHYKALQKWNKVLKKISVKTL